MTIDEEKGCVSPDLHLVPTRMFFCDGEAYEDFINQQIRIPSKYCFGDRGGFAENFITFRYFKTKRLLRFIVRMARDTGGAFYDIYRRYHKLKILLTHRLQRRVGHYGCYALAKDVGSVKRAVREMNEVIAGLVERMELPLRYFKERSIREFFLMLRRNCLAIGADWWTSRGLDKDDLEGMYEVFRNEVVDDALERFGRRRAWVTFGDWQETPDLLEYRGSRRFRKLVEEVYADYLKVHGMTVDELLDIDLYREWVGSDLRGDLESSSDYVADGFLFDGEKTGGEILENHK